MTAAERKKWEDKHPMVKMMVSVPRDSREDIRELRRLLNNEDKATKPNDPWFVRARKRWARTKVTRGDVHPVNVRIMCYRRDAEYLKAFARATFLPGFQPLPESVWQ
jgi:hypothetical protein